MFKKLFVKLKNLPLEIQNLLLLVANSLLILLLRAIFLAASTLVANQPTPLGILFLYSILSNSVLLSNFLFVRLYKRFWKKKVIVSILVILQMVSVGFLVPVLFKYLGGFLFYDLFAG